MKYILMSLFLWCASTSSTPAQVTDTPAPKQRTKGTLYGSWGYNKEWYSKSDIHIKNDGDINQHNQFGSYDFTLHKAKASDRDDFDQIPDVVNITIPQFSARLGYLFNDKRDLGIEINYDHAKYIVNDYQNLRVTGQIFGAPIDKDTLVDPASFLHFEHSDGANFLSVNLVKRYQFYNAPSKKLRFSAVVKAGPGLVYPRTDVTLFGTRVNNKWHVAGYIISAEVGPRLEFFKYFFTEFTGKVGFANYTNSLVLEDTGKANHKFTTAMLIFTFGFQVPL
jgi:hypothetical protein